MTWFQATVFFIPFALLWNFLRRRKPPRFSTRVKPVPLPVTTGPVGYLKAFVAWIFLFTRTFAIRPGIYYLGRYEQEAPLLVTGNFYLTLFILAREIKNTPVRILVIDTGGINVWCSAGKGAFSAQEIIAKARECRLLQEGNKLRLILPKFSLSGVQLSALKSVGINPLIGPLYADEIEQFLSTGKTKSNHGDRVRFGLQERVFSAVPTALQFLYYFLFIYVISIGWVDLNMVWSSTLLAFFYPVLFPYLPGSLFAVKGISLGVVAALLSMLYFTIFNQNEPVVLAQVLFLLPTAIFVGLSYTGNSPISNYTFVRREIAKFLPVIVLLYLIVLIIKIFF